MIAERIGRADRLAVDAAAAAYPVAIAMWRIDAGAERGKAERALDFGRYRPGAVALVVGDIFQRRTAQAAARRQERDRLQAIGLAGAVRPDQRHDIRARRHARRAIVAEVRERQAMDAGYRCHCFCGGGLFFPSPLVGEGGASRSEATGEGALTARRAF